MNRNLAKQQPTPKIGGIRNLSPLYNLLNLKYLITDSGLSLAPEGYSKLYDDGDVSIYRNEHALKRAYAAHHVRTARSESDALRSLFESATLSGRQIVLEGDIGDKMKLKVAGKQDQGNPTNHFVSRFVSITCILLTAAFLVWRSSGLGPWLSRKNHQA